MPSVKENQKICFQRGFAAGAVTSRGFSDVTLITGGVEALGHGLLVDEDSVNGLLELLDGKQLPGYVTHDGAMWGDRLTEECGIFSDFYLDGLKLKAKTFTFLASFIKYQAETYEKLVELAQKIPGQFGLSVVFTGEAMWVCDDGEELDAYAYPKPENCSQDIPSIRFGDVMSADFVKDPAANPDGLLARVDGPGKGMAEKTFSLADHTAALAAKETEVTAALSASHATALSTLKNEHTAALAAKDTALAAKDGEIATLKAGHVTELAAKDSAIADHKKFDVRLSGVPEAVVLAAEMAARGPGGATAIPEPAKTDGEKWEQFNALHAKDPKAAQKFKELHLTRK